MTRVYTGRIGHQCIAGVNTGRVHGYPKMTPVFTGRERRIHEPCSRPMNMSTVYRPLGSVHSTVYTARQHG